MTGAAAAPALHPLPPQALRLDALAAFWRDTPLLAAGTPADLGVMTIGWGGLGTLWKQPVCTVYVRPQRNTFRYMERYDRFSVSFLPKRYAPQLAYCGTHSGCGADKAKACGLHVCQAPDGTPYFREAGCVLLCKKLYRQQLALDCFTDAAAREGYFKTDLHFMYIGRVEAVYAAAQQPNDNAGPGPEERNKAL